MSDMHEPECQNELEKSPSCQRRDGQKTVYPGTYLSPALTLSLSPVCSLFSHLSPSVKFSQNKASILRSMWE